jgi:hypothetical protein
MSKHRRVVAPHGQKMITLKVRFWTDNISKKPGAQLKKECWDAGVVSIAGNRSHGFQTETETLPFNSLPQLLSTLEKLFIKHGIQMHLGSTSIRYHSRRQKKLGV